MKVTPDPSSPDQVLEFLSAPVAQIQEALDDGVSFADERMSGLKPDPYLWAHLVRYQAKQILQKNPSEDWELHQISNSGIEIACGPFVIRTLRSQENRPPNPGASGTRKRFWTQMHQLVFPLDGKAAAPMRGANLILDWTIDQERSVMMALSKPIGTWKYRGQPKLEWRRALAPLVAGSKLSFVSAEEDVIVEPHLDLSEFEQEEEG